MNRAAHLSKEGRLGFSVADGVGGRSGPQVANRKTNCSRRAARGVKELIQGRREGIKDGPDENHGKKFSFLILGIDRYRHTRRENNSILKCKTISTQKPRYT